MSIENRLMRAIHARLVGDGELMALLGAVGVRDRVLPRMALPALIYGEIDSRDHSTATEEGTEHLLMLEVWAPGEGRRLAQEIAALVRACLHGADLALGEGAHLVSLFYTGSISRSDVKTKLHVVAITFRAVTEVPA
jgi:Protein of unknown function (DUF3168)